MSGMRVALLVTCVNDAMFPDTGRAVVTLLSRLGVEVDFPEDLPDMQKRLVDFAAPGLRTILGYP